MGDREVLATPERTTRSSRAGRYIPLRQIRGTNDLRLLFADIVPLLHLDGAPEQAQAVQYSVSEMVRNVLEHSQSPDGAVAAAELYQATDWRQAHVSIGIADCGSGIRRSLSRNFPEIESDRDAVLTAVKPGTTALCAATTARPTTPVPDCSSRGDWRRPPTGSSDY